LVIIPEGAAIDVVEGDDKNVLVQFQGKMYLLTLTPEQLKPFLNFVKGGKRRPSQTRRKIKGGMVSKHVLIQVAKRSIADIKEEIKKVAGSEKEKSLKEKLERITAKLVELEDSVRCVDAADCRVQGGSGSGGRKSRRKNAKRYTKLTRR
jgi:hypothetical protein